MLSVLCMSDLLLRICLGNRHCILQGSTRQLDHYFQRHRWHILQEQDIINISSVDNLVDDSMCEPITVHETTPPNLRGMCPWTYTSDTDEDRYPMRLIIAKCRCSTCADNFECKPVVYKFPVLKKECRHNKIRWVQKLQNIPIACYCARAEIIRADKR